MSAYYRNKNKREPLIKIGSKYENIEYSSKNIDPNLNHLNRQLYAEESLSKARKQRQLEEYSYYAKALENTKPPVDPYANRLNNNILTGKIGQEQKEVDYQRYQQSKSKVESKAFARVPSSTQRRDMRDMNYHGYNIINNNILGFCDPMQKFPTSSYKQTYQGKGLQKEISEMTPSQYEDYQKFRKEQLEIMEQQKRLQQRGQMQQEKDMERTQVDVNAEMEEKKRVMEKKLQMEREYMEKKRQLEMEQRQMDQMQRNYQGQNTYAQAQAQVKAQGQGQVQGNAGYEYDEGMQRQYEQQQQQRVIGSEAEQVNGAMQGGLTEEQMKECQREYEKYLEQQQREGKVGEQQVRDSERDVQQQQQQQGVMERQPQFEGTGSNVNDNQQQVNMNALSEQERAKIEEENYRKAYEAYLLEQERAYQQQQQQQQLQQQPPLKDNPNLDRPIPQEYPQQQQHQQQLPPQQEQQPLQEPSNRISDEEYMRYIEYMNQKEAEERYMKQQQQQQQPHPQYDENEQYQHYLRNNPYQPQPQHPPQSDPQQDLEYLQRLKQYEDIVQDNQPQPQPPQQQQQSLPPQTYSPYAPIAVTPSRAQMNYHNARQKAMQGTVATPGKVTKQNFIHGNPCKLYTYIITSQ